MDFFRLAAAVVIAGIAAVVVARIAAIICAAIIAAAVVIVAVIEAGDTPRCVMYPNNYDGDHHDDPKGLIILEKAACETSVVIVTTHKRLYLLERFLNPYYATGGRLVTQAENLFQ